jgi:hypothetical protein
MMNLIERIICFFTSHFYVPYRGNYRCFNCGYSPKDKKPIETPKQSPQ